MRRILLKTEAAEETAQPGVIPLSLYAQPAIRFPITVLPGRGAITERRCFGF
jgi:hypothetical protein